MTWSNGEAVVLKASGWMPATPSTRSRATSGLPISELGVCATTCARVVRPSFLLVTTISAGSAPSITCRLVAIRSGATKNPLPLDAPPSGPLLGAMISTTAWVSSPASVPWNAWPPGGATTAPGRTGAARSGPMRGSCAVSAVQTSALSSRRRASISRSSAVFCSRWRSVASRVACSFSRATELGRSAIRAATIRAPAYRPMPVNRAAITMAAGISAQSQTERVAPWAGAAKV